MPHCFVSSFRQGSRNPETMDGKAGTFYGSRISISGRRVTPTDNCVVFLYTGQTANYSKHYILELMMPNPHTADHQSDYKTPSTTREYAVSHADLPLRCPLPEMSLWNSHPAVFLPIEDAPKGRILCPYCGTEYVLKD